MNQAATAYTQLAKATQSPRELEADLLIRAAARLQAAYNNWKDDSLHEAIDYNRRLWTILVTSATNPENPLPEQIKHNIANIGVFILNRSHELTLEPQREKLPSLIGLNQEIAAGLRGRA